MEFSEGSEDAYYVDNVQFSDELSDDLGIGEFSEEDGENNEPEVKASSFGGAESDEHTKSAAAIAIPLGMSELGVDTPRSPEFTSKNKSPRPSRNNAADVADPMMYFNFLCDPEEDVVFTAQAEKKLASCNIDPQLIHQVMQLLNPNNLPVITRTQFLRSLEEHKGTQLYAPSFSRADSDTDTDSDEGDADGHERAKGDNGDGKDEDEPEKPHDLPTEPQTTTTSTETIWGFTKKKPRVSTTETTWVVEGEGDEGGKKRTDHILGDVTDTTWAIGSPTFEKKTLRRSTDGSLKRVTSNVNMSWKHEKINTDAQKQIEKLRNKVDLAQSQANLDAQNSQQHIRSLQNELQQVKRQADEKSKVDAATIIGLRTELAEACKKRTDEENQIIVKLKRKIALMQLDSGPVRRSRRMTRRSLKTEFTEFVTEEYTGIGIKSLDSPVTRFSVSSKMRRSIASWNNLFLASVGNLSPSASFRSNFGDSGGNNVSDSPRNLLDNIPRKRKEQRWSYNGGPSARDLLQIRCAKLSMGDQFEGLIDSSTETPTPSPISTPRSPIAALRIDTSSKRLSKSKSPKSRLAKGRMRSPKVRVSKQNSRSKSNSNSPRHALTKSPNLNYSDLSLISPKNSPRGNKISNNKSSPRGEKGKSSKKNKVLGVSPTHSNSPLNLGEVTVAMVDTEQEAKVHHLSQQNFELEKNVAGLKGANAELTATNKNLLAKIKRLRTGIVGFKTEFKTVRTQLNQLQARVEEGRDSSEKHLRRSKSKFLRYLKQRRKLQRSKAKLMQVRLKRQSAREAEEHRRKEQTAQQNIKQITATLEKLQNEEKTIRMRLSTMQLPTGDNKEAEADQAKKIEEMETLHIKEIEELKCQMVDADRAHMASMQALQAELDSTKSLLASKEKLLAEKEKSEATVVAESENGVTDQPRRRRPPKLALASEGVSEDAVSDIGVSEDAVSDIVNAVAAVEANNALEKVEEMEGARRRRPPADAGLVSFADIGDDGSVPAKGIEPSVDLTRPTLAPAPAPKPKQNRKHLRHLSIFYDKPDADESDVRALMSVRSMKMGIAAVKYSWKKASQARQRWVTVDSFETKICWAKKKGRAPYHFIPIDRIRRIVFGYSMLLRERAKERPPWCCFSIRTIDSKRTFDFVCTNHMDALYFVHGLRYLCSTKPETKITKMTLGSMLWERSRMILGAKARKENITRMAALKKVVLAAAQKSIQ